MCISSMNTACLLHLRTFGFTSSFIERRHECRLPQGSTLAHQMCFCSLIELQPSCAENSALLSVHVAHRKAWLAFTGSTKNVCTATNSPVSLLMSSACYAQRNFLLFLANSNFIISLWFFCSLTFQSVLPFTELENKTIK